MIICAYDLETTGISDPIYPVEIGAVLYDTDTQAERAVVSLIVRPEEWQVPDIAARVHGIIHANAERLGVPLIIALAALTNLWSVADARVAHNAEYDDKVIDGTIAWIGRASSLRRPPGYCTKDLAAPVINIPPTDKMIAAGYGNKPKAPRLSECYEYFFNEKINDAHTALADARACLRVFIALLRCGAVVPPTQ